MDLERVSNVHKLYSFKSWTVMFTVYWYKVIYIIYLLLWFKFHQNQTLFWYSSLYTCSLPLLMTTAKRLGIDGIILHKGMSHVPMYQYKTSEKSSGRGWIRRKSQTSTPSSFASTRFGGNLTMTSCLSYV